MVTTRSMSSRASPSSSSLIPLKAWKSLINARAKALKLLNPTRWSDLPEGPLINIAQRLPRYDDFDAMRRVCRHWRLVMTDFPYATTAPQVPWLMLPSEDDGDYQDDDHRHLLLHHRSGGRHRHPIINANAKFRRFYRLSNLLGNRYIRLNLPEETRGRRCVSSQGWMMTAADDAPLAFFNPFSGARIDIPDMERPGKNPHSGNARVPFIHKFVMSSSPSLTDDFWIVIIYGRKGSLAIWRPGYGCWIKLNNIDSDEDTTFMDVAFCDGQLYAVSSDRDIYSCSLIKDQDAAAADLAMDFVMDTAVAFPDISISMMYLVELDGKLVLVGRGVAVLRENHSDYATYKFWLRELKLKENEVKAVSLKSLGNKALFLGDNQSFLIEASERYGCEANCIYFTDNVWINWKPVPTQGGGKDLGVFMLSIRKVGSYYHGRKTMSVTTPPIWVEPRC